jgi:hypothetical protein
MRAYRAVTSSADVEATAAQIATTVQATEMVLAGLRAVSNGLVRPLLVHPPDNDRHHPPGSSERGLAMPPPIRSSTDHS